MKAILIAAGLLMAGASVYGVVDYNKKAKSQEFKELYKEKPAPVETDAVKEEITTPIEEKKDVSGVSNEVKTENPVEKNVVNKKKVVKKKKEEERVFRVREFSRGKLG